MYCRFIAWTVQYTSVKLHSTVDCSTDIVAINVHGLHSTPYLSESQLRDRFDFRAFSNTAFGFPAETQIGFPPLYRLYFLFRSRCIFRHGCHPQAAEGVRRPQEVGRQVVQGHTGECQTLTPFLYSLFTLAPKWCLRLFLMILIFYTNNLIHSESESGIRGIKWFNRPDIQTKTFFRLFWNGVESLAQIICCSVSSVQSFSLAWGRSRTVFYWLYNLFRTTITQIRVTISSIYTLGCIYYKIHRPSLADQLK